MYRAMLLTGIVFVAMDSHCAGGGEASLSSKKRKIKEVSEGISLEKPAKSPKVMPALSGPSSLQYSKPLFDAVSTMPHFNSSVIDGLRVQMELALQEKVLRINLVKQLMDAGKAVVTNDLEQAEADLLAVPLCALQLAKLYRCSLLQFDIEWETWSQNYGVAFLSTPENSESILFSKGVDSQSDVPQQGEGGSTVDSEESGEGSDS